MKFTTLNLPISQFVIAALIVATSGVCIMVAKANASTQVEKRHIEANGPRPLAVAIKELETRQGLVITYEDPIYIHGSDMQELPASMTNARKIMIPRAGRISATYEAKSTGEISDLENAIENLIHVNTNMKNPGEFELLSNDKRMHVIPSRVKNSQGVLTRVTPLLNTRITLPAREMTGIEALSELCAQISDKTGVKLTTGMIPFNLFNQHKVSLDASNKVAREVLVEILTSLESYASPQRPFGWQLFYDPGLQWSLLNIHLVQKGAESNK